MLIEFKIGNFRSFWTSQALQLTTDSSKELIDTNVIETGIKRIPRLLKSAVIYGPNAAGKSNIVKAARFMKNFILNSAKEGQADEPINVTPFLFVKGGSDKPSEFEMAFITQGVMYHFGFLVTQKQVVQEWLFAYPEGRAQKWYERIFDPAKEEYTWHFSSKFTGPKKIWREATRKNALFLSTAIQLNNQQLKPVFEWFGKLAVIDSQMLLDANFTADKCKDAKRKKLILDFLKAADISIEDIILEKREFSMDILPKHLPKVLKESVRQAMDGKKFTEIFFQHPVTDSNEFVKLPLYEESDGTQKLFAYAAPWLDILENGLVVFIDELERSLHPQIIEFLIDLIHNPKINRKNGQLVFTTHNTHLLSSGLMRRDQVWFVEKDEFNSTSLFPLSDFKPRKHEALEKGYLKGRYGAVPFLRELFSFTEKK